MCKLKFSKFHNNFDMEAGINKHTMSGTMASGKIGKIENRGKLEKVKIEIYVLCMCRSRM